MVPGSNLLIQAFAAITPITVQYYAFQSRSTNGIGQFVSTYAPPVPVTASVQAVPREVYQEFGLDFQKNYVMIFALVDSTDLDRDQTGDQFKLPDGRIYQVVSEADWFGEDGGWQGSQGWVGPLICVKLIQPTGAIYT
jgi:hypothetical protein